MGIYVCMFLKQNYFKAKEFEKEEGRKKKKSTLYHMIML